MYKETQQKPIISPFDHKSTAEQVMKDIELTGKNIIITGGYSGIGLKMTKLLANAGANVIAPARNPAKAKAALSGLKNVEAATLDLMEPVSIDSFAAQFIHSDRKLDLLIESAGIMFPPLLRDSRGNESQFSTNFLGHFQLAAGLFPALKKAGNARVILLSSRAQSWNGVDFSDPNFLTRPYDPKVAYAQSKAADILFAVALDRRAQKDGVRAFAVHPGLVPGTALGRFTNPSPAAQKLAAIALNQLGGTHLISLKNSLQAKRKHQREYDYFKTVSQGAASPLWAATSPLLKSKGGVFIEDCNIGIAVSAKSRSKFGVRPWSNDPIFAEKLWHLGEELTGKKWTF